MLGPTLAPEQQEALMHILMALQQSGEALPPQDLDTVQVSIWHCLIPFQQRRCMLFVHCAV